MRKNSIDNYESINVRLTKEKTPIAFAKKVDEMVNMGMTQEEAETYVSQCEFEMEFYYSDNLGLFMVESEAVENTTIFDPYTGDEMEECEE